MVFARPDSRPFGMKDPKDLFVRRFLVMTCWVGTSGGGAGGCGGEDRGDGDAGWDTTPACFSV